MLKEVLEAQIFIAGNLFVNQKFKVESQSKLIKEIYLSRPT